MRGKDLPGELQQGEGNIGEDSSHSPEVPPELSRLQRASAGIVMAFCAGLVFMTGSTSPEYASDLDQIWHAARAVLAGLDPYAPEAASWVSDWGFPLYYPLPAILAAVPLALLPLAAARLVFVVASTFLLAYGLTRSGAHRLLVFGSGAYLGALASAQWSPLLTASLVLPALAPAIVVKPNIGAALLGAVPTRRFVAAGFAGGAGLGLMAFLVDPAWLVKWIGAVGEAPHIHSPLLLPGGLLVLVALLRWRRWEARLLVALAIVPHTTLAYEALPLLLVARGWKQLLGLALLSQVALVGQFVLDPRGSGSGGAALAEFAQWTRRVGMLNLALLYLPATLMVLQRPNERSRPP